MTDELENLRPEVREAYATLDTEVSPSGRVSYEAYRAWCTIHAELLRLAALEHAWQQWIKDGMRVEFLPPELPK